MILHARREIDELRYSPSSLSEERCSSVSVEALLLQAAARLLLLRGLQKSNERPSMFRMDARIQKARIMHYDVAGGESNSVAPRHP